MGVLALCAVALLLRLRGIDFLLPHLTPPDSHHIVRQVELLREPPPDPAADVNYGKYPHLIAHVVALLPEPDPGARAPVELEEHLRRAAEPFLRVRTAVAGLSVLVVPATFLLARWFLSARWSLFAAFLVASSLLHLGFSQQARPHAPATALSALAVLAAVWMRNGRGWTPSVAAGVAAALAVGCLHSGVLVLPPLVAAHVLRRREPGGTTAWAILIPGALVALAIVFFYPFLFVESRGRDAAQLELHPQGLIQAGHVISFSWFQGDGFQRVARTLWSYEPVALVLALLGLLAWAASGRPAGRDAGEESRKDLLVVLAHAVPYLLVLGAYDRTYERLVLPLVPSVACLAALGLRETLRGLSSRVSIPAARHGLAAAVLAVAVGLPAAAAWRLTSLRAAPDTATQVARWIRSNLQPGTPIALSNGFGLPLFCTAETLREDPGALRGLSRLWTDYQLSLDPEQYDHRGYDLRWLPIRQRRDFERIRRDPAGFLDRLEADYILLDNPGSPTRPPAVAKLYDVARARGERVFEVAPDAVGRELGQPLDYRDSPFGEVPHFTLRVLRATSVGPTVEVLRMGP